MIAAARFLSARGAGESFARLAIALMAMPLFEAFLRGQVEQHGLDVGVRQVRGNLRTHDAGAENRGLANA